MLSVLQPASNLCLQPSTNNNVSSLLHKPNKKYPQPYGIIPPRKKNTSSSSTSLRSSSTTPTAQSSLVSVKINDKEPKLVTSSHESSSIFNSLQSLLLSDSTSSSYRPGFWSQIKAQLPPWASSPSSSYAGKPSNNNNAKGNHNSITRDFAPPLACLLSNSSPIVTLNSTSLVVSSTEDVLLSLSNADTLDGIDGNNISLTSGFYSASVAAVDKLKVMRTDNIPLKTFNYHETELKEKVKDSNSVPVLKRAIPRPSPQVLSSSSRTPTPEKKHENLPLPRHLACREMRSNSDYLRMMAPEMNMIRARKLIAPLKPRGYLPRRKELFSIVKTSLCVSIDIPCEDEEDNLVVGSWTSVSSTGTYLSATSADYMTADEDNFD